MVERFDEMRAAMVASQLRPNGVDDPALLTAVMATPREAFVPAERRMLAYADVQHPIAPGRFLNTPMVQGRLLGALQIQPGERVLLVGAGTGYLAAVLAALGAQVVALEQDELFAAPLAQLPVTRATGALTEGAPADAPFDAILIDGAVEQVPAALVAQLAENGRLATGLVDNGPTRLALGRKGRGGFALVPFGDADVAVLADFVRPPSFVF